jgi:hypothetical protein
MKTKGAQNGKRGVDTPNIPAPASPINTAAIQHASIEPISVGSRNSPRLVIAESGIANT